MRNTYIYNNDVELGHDKLRTCKKPANIKRWNPAFTPITHAPTSEQFLIALFFFLILYSSTLTLLIHTAARFYDSLLLCYLGEPRDHHVLDYQPLQGGQAWAAVQHTWEYHLLFTTTHQLTKAKSQLITLIVYSLLFAVADTKLKGWTRVMRKAGMITAPSTPSNSNKTPVCFTNMTAFVNAIISVLV